MHITSAVEEFPEVGLWVCLIIICEHHDRPRSPVVAVQDHALLRLTHGCHTLLTLSSVQGPFEFAISLL